MPTAEDKKRIVLGSGKLYIAEFTGADIPENATLEVDTNLLGNISGGASIEYKPEFYTAEDDLGLIKKSIMTKEEAILKSGFMSINGNTFKKLCSTARVSEDTSKKTRTVKIGGVGNQDSKNYIIRFVHNDAIDGDIRLTIVGKNESGFTFAFAKDKETIIDAEFKAIPHDADGTLIVYEEAITVTGV